MGIKWSVVPAALGLAGIVVLGFAQSWDAQLWANAIQTIALVVAAAAALGTYRQVSLARHGGSGANNLVVWEKLQIDVARANRKIVIDKFEQDGPYNPTTWSEAEGRAAHEVSALLASVGALAKRDVVSTDLFATEWGPVIVKSWAACADYVQAERIRRPDPRLWVHFEWLKDEAVKRL